MGVGKECKSYTNRLKNMPTEEGRDDAAMEKLNK